MKHRNSGYPGVEWEYPFWHDALLLAGVWSAFMLLFWLVS